MKGKIEVIAIRLKAAILRNPVEVLLAILFCVFRCYNYDNRTEELRNIISYFPVFFLSAYLLNQLTVGKKMRLAYYLSLFFFFPFFWIELEPFGATFWVSLIVIQLVYLIGGWKRDNDQFIQFGLYYLLALASALLLSGIACLLSVSIYFSIQYIFEIWEHGELFFITCSSIIFLVIFPLLFLMFDQKKEYGYRVENKLIDILFNYVLSPALLIYGGILYIYLVKITVLWSLPKGGVAYIVIGFVTVAFLLKGFQNFLSGRYYNWFYKHTSLIVLPTLVMYWVGACYRINQYGFTEARVYLVVVGLILSGMAILFFTRRWGHYLYVACLVVVLLSFVTYIPGIRAKDIEIISQSARDNYPLKENAIPLFLTIQDRNPINIVGFRTVQLVDDYRSTNIWMNTQRDTLFVYDGEKELYKENLNALLEKQLSKIGVINGSDTIPLAAYPELLRLDMDSATLLFKNMSIRKETAYKLYNIDGGLYLKR